MSEPKYPIRTEILVLGPDDPKQKPLGFLVVPREGTAVYKPDADGVPLTAREDVQPGMQVVITGLFDRYLKEVFLDEAGILRAGTPENFSLLAFDADDRHCWTSPGNVNLRGVTKTTASRT